MKRNLIIIVLAMLAAGTSAAAPQPAVEWSGWGYAAGITVRSTLGWRFHVSEDSDVWVSALGACDNTYNGLWEGLDVDHHIAIWPAVGGAPIVTGTVPAGTVTPLQGHFRYVNIPRVRLLSGRDYVIGDDGFCNADNHLMADPIQNAVTYAPGITWQALRISTDSHITNNLVFPNEEVTIPRPIFGPSFRVSLAPPELSIRTSEVELCWDTATNKWYQLQYRSSLTTNQWTSLTTGWFVGDDSRFCTNDAVLADQVQRYYRLAVTNSPP
jgi:hypothetical protein